MKKNYAERIENINFCYAGQAESLRVCLATAAPCFLFLFLNALMDSVVMCFIFRLILS